MAWQGLNCLLTRESRFESEVTECGLGLGGISVSAVPWIMALTRRETNGGGGVHVSPGTRASQHARLSHSAWNASPPRGHNVLSSAVPKPFFSLQKKGPHGQEICSNVLQPLIIIPL